MNFLSVREVAKARGQHYATIVRECQSGKIPAIKPSGRTWRIPSTYLDDLAASAYERLASIAKVAEAVDSGGPTALDLALAEARASLRRNRFPAVRGGGDDG